MQFYRPGKKKATALFSNRAVDPRGLLDSVRGDARAAVGTSFALVESEDGSTRRQRTAAFARRWCWGWGEFAAAVVSVMAASGRTSGSGPDAPFPSAASNGPMPPRGWASQRAVFVRETLSSSTEVNLSPPNTTPRHLLSREQRTCRPPLWEVCLTMHAHLCVRVFLCLGHTTTLRWAASDGEGGEETGHGYVARSVWGGDGGRERSGEGGPASLLETALRVTARRSCLLQACLPCAAAFPAVCSHQLAQPRRGPCALRRHAVPRCAMPVRPCEQARRQTCTA